ncbi:MAG: signal peptide peptidase SppA [Aeoliella sp.]
MPPSPTSTNRFLASWMAFICAGLMLAMGPSAQADDTAVADSEPATETSEVKAEPAAENKEKEKESQKVAEKLTKARLALVVLSQSMPESPGVMGPFGDMQLDLRSTIGRLEKAAEDDTIDGLVLQIRNPTIGRGKVHELRAAITRFRTGGKKVYAQLEMAMPGDYLIASACDEIVMPESGMVLLPGLRMEAMFYKGLLDKVGIRADFIHMGDAKGAAEPMTRRKFSKPVRENLSAMVDDLYEQMVETVAFDRPITRAQATAAIDEGLMTAKRAKELGLVDRLAYATDLRNSLGETYDADKLVYVENYGKKEVDTDFSGPAGLLKLLKLMSGGSSSSRSSGKKIAVVYAVGPITTGKSSQGLFGGASLGSTTIVKALREAADDDDVSAIVLRINSPGGSAIASDLMWSQIEAIDKPIVASMGDVAASGGYYIAMGADKIIAEPTTITGSIGVVGGKMAMQGLYDKLGITIDTISRGKNSGLFSGTKKFSPNEREAMVAMMEDTYDQFTSKAAAGRKMPVDQLKKLAGGRVYSGRQAKANGLVDELGTLHDAIAAAKKMAGIDADEKVKIKTLPKPVDFFDALFGDTDAEKEVAVRLDLSVVSPELKAIARRASMLQRVFREPVVLMMPFELEIK